MKTSRIPLICTVSLACALSFATVPALGAEAVPAATSEPVLPLPAGSTRIVKVIAPTVATSRFDGGRTVLRLQPTEQWGGPTQLRVKRLRRLPDGGISYQVFLNKRPNGSLGWVHSDRVLETSTPWSIVIDLSDRKVLTFRAGRLKRASRAVVGAPSTPTPVGEFYLADRIRRANPREFAGSWVLTFAYSNVLQQFAGGPGRVAMHGRGGSSLKTPLGTAASHGCVRLNNADIAWIAQRVPEGTPIRVRN